LGGWKDIQPVKIHSANPRGSVTEQVEEEDPGENWLMHVQLE